MTVELIAEAGSNWQGDLTVLDALARAARRAGADTLKVQHYPVEGFGPHPFDRETLRHAQQIAQSHGLRFLASVFDIPTLNEYVDVCGATRVKIASPELTRDDILAETAGMHVLLSTGMSTDEQIGHAFDTLVDAEADEITLLHCVSAYPAPDEHMNLNAIGTLADTFNCDVGLSDHSLDPIVAPVAAIALGAKVIEKHFTLDRDMDGPDHFYAVNEDGFHRMAQAVRMAEVMLGDGELKVMPCEDPYDRRT